jgi:hypothetical protein
MYGHAAAFKKALLKQEDGSMVGLQNESGKYFYYNLKGNGGDW